MICDASEESPRGSVLPEDALKTFLPSRCFYTRWGASLAFRALLIAKGELNEVKARCAQKLLCA